LLAHRLAHLLYKKNYLMAARAISQTAKFFTGIEIHPGATIGKGLFIDHGSGVVIGETAEIGDNCTIYQGVTLGGTGKDVGKRHPTLGNHVMVGAGAKVLGPLQIGDYTKIAAGAVVLKDIPAHSTAVGIPAKVVKSGNRRVEEELDQIHIPDPVAQQIAKMQERIDRLEKELEQMEKTES
jgi:serine O-acetyltransferase